MSEETQKSGAGKGLAIAGLVLGIIALVFSFVPCLGMYAAVPGFIAIILSAIGLAQASKGGASKGLAIAALVISILATSIAAWQYYVLSTGFETLNDAAMDGTLQDAFQDAASEMQDAANEMQESAE